MSDDQEFEPLEDSADDILARMRQLFCKAMHNDFSDSLTEISVELSGAPMETLYGFVLPVKFNDKIDFEKFSDPAAFQVLSEDGAELNFEVDYWTPSASQGVLWVRLDSLPAGTQRVDLSLALREKPLAPQGAFGDSLPAEGTAYTPGDWHLPWRSGIIK